MSAIEETPAGVMVPWPQLPYADAVHVALDALGFLPDTVEAGARREALGPTAGELFVRLEWLPGNDDLVPTALCADGLIVQWSDLTGWSVRSGEDLFTPQLSPVASPALVADVALHAALHGLRCVCERPDPTARWDQAHHLDAALQAYDDRPVTW